MTPGKHEIGPTRLSAEGALELLRRQHRMYGDLRRLADRQHRLVAGEDPSALIALLEDRRKLTSRLVELSREASPLRDRWPAIRAALPAPQRAEAERMLGDMNELLGVIMAGDEGDARLLSARKVQSAQAIRALVANREAVSAYKSSGGPASGQLNEISEDA